MADALRVHGFFELIRSSYSEPFILCRAIFPPCLSFPMHSVIIWSENCNLENITVALIGHKK